MRPLQSSAQGGSGSRSSWFSTSTGLLASLVSLAYLSSFAKADIQCTQFGSDTFHVNSTIKFQWNDTQTVPIQMFNLDLYCYQNNQLLYTVGTLNTSSSISPQNWVVDSTIMNTLGNCSLAQYQGRFDWTYTDPTSGAAMTGSAPCKVMLLVGPGVNPLTGGSTPDPQPTDDPNPGPVVISDRTKMIVIGVGCAVGVLVLAGVVGFYIIRHQNKRAEQDLANRKLREPLQSDPSSYTEGGNGGGAGAGAAARYNELSSVNTSVTSYSPLARGEMVEMGGLPPSRSSFSHSRPHSLTSGSHSPMPIAAQHSRLSGHTMTPSGLSQPSGSFVNNDRPPSLLTSPFIPPGEEDFPGETAATNRDRRRQEEEELQRQQYEQQLHQQQQQQHLQQQQQQQLNYGSYQY